MTYTITSLKVRKNLGQKRILIFDYEQHCLFFFLLFLNFYPHNNKGFNLLFYKIITPYSFV